DRVDRVVGIAAGVAVGVQAPAPPRAREELHPPDGAGGRDVEVAPVVGLDLVDRGEDLPPDAVLDARRLVDRQQERRDPELVDEEVRDADRRRTRQRERERRVVRGGRAARRARVVDLRLGGAEGLSGHALSPRFRTLDLLFSLALGLSGLLLGLLLGLVVGGRRGGGSLGRRLHGRRGGGGGGLLIGGRRRRLRDLGDAD